MPIRIGPRMIDVLTYVKANPNCIMIRAAEHVAPNGSLKYGYATVHRAIDAGIIVAVKGARNWTYLNIP